VARAPFGPNELFVTALSPAEEPFGVLFPRSSPEALARRLAEVSNQLVYVYDLVARRNVFATDRLLDLLGYSPEEAQAMGDNFLVQLIHPEDLPAVGEHHRRLESAADLTVHEIRYRVRHADGSYRWLQSRETPLDRDEEYGSVTRFLGFAEDITERLAADKALREANVRLATNLAALERYHRHLEVLAELGELLQSADDQDEFFQVASSYVQRLFPERRGFLAVTTRDRERMSLAFSWGAGDVALEDPAALPASACWAVRRGRPHIAQAGARQLHCRHAAASGELATACVPVMCQGHVRGVFHVASTLAEDARDVWHMVRLAKATAKGIELAFNNLLLRERLREQALRDPLTDLYNRRYMEDALEREIHRARRARTPVSMLVVDVDHFKALNDAYGHDAGDEVLRSLADTFQSSIRDSDIACRYGGEEFALVLPDCETRVAVEKAERIRRQVAQMVVPYADDVIDGITVSIGVATTGGADGWDGRDLFRVADRALYAAKHAGRDRVVVYRQSGEPVGSVPPGIDAVPTEPPTRVLSSVPQAAVSAGAGPKTPRHEANPGEERRRHRAH